MLVKNLNSSIIESVSYENKVLSILLTSGRAYAYEGVPRKVFNEFCASDSKGKFYNENIRGEYDSIEITEAS